MQNHCGQDSLHVNVTCLYYSAPWSTRLFPSYLYGYLVTKSLPTLGDPMHSSTPHLPVLHHLPEPVKTHVHPVSDAIQPSHPLSSPSPPALNLSQHQGLSNESVLHIRWPRYWSFRIRPFNEHSGLISFRIDEFDLFTIQGTLKSLL